MVAPQHEEEEGKVVGEEGSVQSASLWLHKKTTGQIRSLTIAESSEYGGYTRPAQHHPQLCRRPHVQSGITSRAFLSGQPSAVRTQHKDTVQDKWSRCWSAIAMCGKRRNVVPEAFWARETVAWTGSWGLKPSDNTSVPPHMRSFSKQPRHRHRPVDTRGWKDSLLIHIQSAERLRLPA